MRPLSYYVKKTREVYLEDGAADLLATAARFGIGSVDLFYLRNVARRKIALRKVQGSKMFLLVNDPAICRELIVRGCHEKLSTRAISKELSPGMRVIDIGANIGYYALLEAKAVGSSGKIHAIEPEPTNVDMLRRNLEVNGVTNVVHVHQLAIGAEDCVSTMYLSDASSRHTFASSSQKRNAGTLQVRMTTLDSFLAEQGEAGESIDFVRMDVEGYEGNILRGMKDTLESSDAMKMFIEFHPRMIDSIPGYSFQSTLELLDSFGFTAQRLITADENGKVCFEDMSIRSILADKWLMEEKTGMEAWLEKSG